MAIGESQLIGAAGQYYVGYKLSENRLCAAQTIGNAVGADILVCDDKGIETCSIQVKTSKNAYRANRYGCEGYEFDVGASVIGKQSSNLWYAFVNLQQKDNLFHPQVFIVPSKWVSDFLKPSFSRKIFFLSMEASELCLERWDYISKTLEKDQTVIDFASKWSDKMVRWGSKN